MSNSTSNQTDHQGTKAPSIEEVRNRWNKMSPVYVTMDSAPQTFFYALTNMLKLNQAKNILEIACGAGKLIPQVLDLKSPQTFYYATDISEEMIKFAKSRLQNHFQNYQSKLTLDQWIKKQNLEFAVVNGEQKIPKQIKFDRIICNLVLMLTTDPKNMLQNLYQHAQEGCLLGLTVWGDRSKNPFFSAIEDIGRQNKLTPPNARSNFFLYEKIEDLTEQCGWQKVLSWQQNGMLPVIDYCPPQNMHPFIQKEVLLRFPPELHHLVHEKVNELVNVKKCGITFSCKLMIVRKKGKKQ